MLGGAREKGPSMDVAFADYLAKADLTALYWPSINSRTISISASKDTDGDGVKDIEEIKQEQDLLISRRSNNQPVIHLPVKMDQTYIQWIGAILPNPNINDKEYFYIC